VVGNASCFGATSIAALLLVFRVAPPARASCAGPTEEVLWSYPAAGATEVPTNTRLWVATSYPRDPAEVRLDGQLLLIGQWPFEYVVPGELAAQTTYRVEIDVLGNGSPEVSFEFTTGSGPVEAGDLPSFAEPMLDWDDDRQLEAPCGALAGELECWDTGDPVLLNFNIEHDAWAWVIEFPSEPGGNMPQRLLWPAQCGPPSLLTTIRSRCYDLVAVDSTGNARRAGPFCPPPFISQDGGLGSDAGPREATGTGGCSCALAQAQNSTRWPLALLGMVTLLAVLLRRRGIDSGGVSTRHGD